MSRKRQNNAVRWRTSEASFNYKSLFEQQAISMKSWLENLGTSILTQRVILISHPEMKLHPQKPTIHALTCRLLIHWTSKVSVTSPKTDDMQFQYIKKTPDPSAENAHNAFTISSNVSVQPAHFSHAKIFLFPIMVREVRIGMTLWRVRHQNC